MPGWTCFTSFNQRLYDIIAAEMLASWLYHWPRDIRLVIYLEDDIDLPRDPRIEIRSWEQNCRAMFDRVGAAAANQVFWQSEHTRRYTKKAVCFMHMLAADPGRVCWLDADILTLKTVPDDILDRAWSKHHAITLFDGSRPPTETSHAWTAESGFVIMDTQHPGFPALLQIYKNYYETATMPPHAGFFWDGEILMHAAKESGSYFDLRTQCRGKSSTPLHAHWLGEYLTHMKSKRKKHYSLANYRRYWLEGVDIATAETKHPWQR